MHETHYRVNEIERRHTEDIHQLRMLADTIPLTTVSRAFVASLGSRRLSGRSALGSYAFARVLPAHDLRPREGTFATICVDCGWSEMPKSRESYDAETQQHYADERSRFGGVRHDQPQYAPYDLGAFVADDCVTTPTVDDWRTLALILHTPERLKPDAKPSDLERALKSLFPSNKNERGMLIRILAYAGIFEDPGHPGYLNSYVPPVKREMPPYRFLDWGYPAIWWRARFGVREDAVQFWFPDVCEYNVSSF
jgi:hypothetical protein